jgi:uncharacterized protein YpmS
MSGSSMPENQWRYGFFAVLALSILLVIGMVVYLWRKKRSEVATMLWSAWEPLDCSTLCSKRGPE